MIAAIDAGRVDGRDPAVLAHAIQDVIDALSRQPGWWSVQRNQPLAPGPIGGRPDTCLTRPGGVKQPIGKRQDGFQYLGEVRR